MLEQFTTTNGSDDRGLDSWIAFATSSFPVPLSPVINTVESVEGVTQFDVLPELLVE
jgi:hypothetical protein